MTERARMAAEIGTASDHLAMKVAVKVTAANARAFHANATRSRISIPTIAARTSTTTARQNFQSMQSPECQTP